MAGRGHGRRFQGIVLNHRQACLFKPGTELTLRDEELGLATFFGGRAQVLNDLFGAPTVDKEASAVREFLHKE